MKVPSAKLYSERIVMVVPISRTHYVVPPIGLGYLATALRRHGFSDVVILDCLKERLSFKDLKARLLQLKPRVAGFQVFSRDFDSVARSIQALKKISPESIVVIGGPHVSATNVTALKEMEGADFALEGEGEEAFALLMERILRGAKNHFEDIPGLIWRDNGHIRKNNRKMVDDLDRLGFPAWDLMRPDEYPDSPQGAFYKKFPIAPISTTRGCPFLCTFCGSGVNMGRTLRARSMEHVFGEMDMLYEDYGVREFHIIDDMFNFKKQRVLEFCGKIKKRKWDISYTFPNGLRLNYLDKEMLADMKETGAYAFTVGIESGSQRILNRMKKNLTLELIEEKVNLIRETGLEPSGFFIIGYPGETIEDIKATISFAKRLKLKRVHFSNFLPLPGTEATQGLLESGEIKIPEWRRLSYSKVVYSPKGITKKQLKKLQRKAFLEFHLRPGIFLKMLTEIKSFNHLMTILRRATDYLFRG